MTNINKATINLDSKIDIETAISDIENETNYLIKIERIKEVKVKIKNLIDQFKELREQFVANLD